MGKNTTNTSSFRLPDHLLTGGSSIRSAARWAMCPLITRARLGEQTWTGSGRPCRLDREVCPTWSRPARRWARSPPKPPRQPVSRQAAVIAAAADKACEVLGSGCLEPQCACLSYGTTATINTTHRKYIEVIPLIPPYPAAVPGVL